MTADQTIARPVQLIREAPEVEAPARPEPHGPPDAAESLLAWLDRRRWWLFGLLGVIYLAGFTGRWLINPDSALYASLGRNVAEGLGYTYQGQLHTWAEPGLPYLIAGTFKIVGIDDMRLATLAMLACAIGSLALTYALFKLHAGRPVAVLMVGLLGLSENFHRYSYLVLTDMPFLLGAIAFLVGYERVVFAQAERDKRLRGPLSWALVAGGTLLMLSFRPTVLMFLAALAVATAWHLRPHRGWLTEFVRRTRGHLLRAALIVAPIAAAAALLMLLFRPIVPMFLAAGAVAAGWLLARGPERRRHMAVASVVLLCVLAFRLTDPRRSAPGQLDHREAKGTELVTEKGGFLVSRALMTNAPMLVNETTTEAFFAVWLGTGVTTILALTVLGLGFGLVRRRVLWGMWVAATLGQMVLFLPRERYFLPVLPLMLYALWRGICCLSARVPPRWRGPVVGACLAVLVVPNTILIVRSIAKQHSPPARDQNTSLITMAEHVKRTAGTRDLVIAEEGRVLHHFSRRNAVSPAIGRATPAGRVEAEAHRRNVESAETLYAVLPGEFIGRELELLSLEVEPGPPVATVPSYDRRGREREVPLTLHRLRRRAENSRSGG